MAIHMGLRASEKKDFEALLASHHWIEVRLVLMDLDHNEVAGGDISRRLLDGQVTFDGEQDVSRSLDLDLLDPTGALHLDSKSPSAGAMFADRMIQVRYSVINPTRTTRYTVPLFTGPITKLDRNGAVIQVECQGKEIFGLTQAWNARTFKKGLKVTNVIETIVRDIIGERYYDIPDLKNKLPRNVSVGDDRLPWVVAKQLAESIGYQLFYNGRGRCQMRKIPHGVAFSFKQGPGGTVKSEPEVGFDIDDVVNAVEVFGKKPVKKKGKPARPRPHARVVAARSHPLSPWALGRKGGPRYLPRVIEDDSITSDKEAKERANAALKRGLLESVDVGYDTIVVPHLEEMDVVKLSTEKFSANHRLVKFAVPLNAAGDSSVGYVRNVKLRSGRVRRKPKRRHHRRKKGKD